MLDIIFSNSFLNGYKTLKKKHYKVEKVDEVIKILSNQQKLSSKYKNHFLKGDLQGYQECHIESNLLLVYKIIDNKLLLSQLGTHDDLF